MKYNNDLFLITFLILVVPVIASAQTDTTASKTDSTAVKIDTSSRVVSDTVATKPAPAKGDTADIAATPMNCYKEWVNYFTELGSKPVTDGTQLIVIAFKSKDNCRCLMGKVDVSEGKIKSPVYVQTEGGDYKTFTALGKKLDPDFIAAHGEDLWHIANGMSVVFQTTDHEYGRIFFYKFLNKNKQMSKEAPSPADLINH